MTGQLKRVVSVLLLSIGLLLSCMHAVQAENQRCEKPVFYAQTANHKKEVEICIITPSVSYTFGKAGAKNKEMNLTVPAGSASYAYTSNQVISIQVFTVRNGDTSYQISAGMNDSGEPLASLYVYKGMPESGKLLTEIKLDPATVKNSISHALAEEGIPEAASL